MPVPASTDSRARVQLIRARMERNKENSSRFKTVIHETFSKFKTSFRSVPSSFFNQELLDWCLDNLDDAEDLRQQLVYVLTCAKDKQVFFRNTDAAASYVQTGLTSIKKGHWPSWNVHSVYKPPQTGFDVADGIKGVDGVKGADVVKGADGIEGAKGVDGVDVLRGVMDECIEKFDMMKNFKFVDHSSQLYTDAMLGKFKAAGITPDDLRDHMYRVADSSRYPHLFNTGSDKLSAQNAIESYILRRHDRIINFERMKTAIERGTKFLSPDLLPGSVESLMTQFVVNSVIRKTLDAAFVETSIRSAVVRANESGERIDDAYAFIMNAVEHGFAMRCGLPLRPSTPPIEDAQCSSTPSSQQGPPPPAVIVRQPPPAAVVVPQQKAFASSPQGPPPPAVILPQEKAPAAVVVPQEKAFASSPQGPPPPAVIVVPQQKAFASSPQGPPPPAVILPQQKAPAAVVVTPARRTQLIASGFFEAMSSTGEMPVLRSLDMQSDEFLFYQRGMVMAMEVTARGDTRAIAHLREVLKQQVQY
jgi:hypothetical protein